MPLDVSLFWVPTGGDITPEKAQRPRTDSWSQLANHMGHLPHSGSAPDENDLAWPETPRRPGEGEGEEKYDSV